ncbi:MAG TPA: hypothetical protein DHW02_08830 [Ktedonobacter sp.]|nr:hypothetical protein [Ktedonobacter sp.]
MAGLQLVALLCIMFLALGAFNILMARRRQQRESAMGIQYPWYKRLTILTSVEYVLLALAFLLNLGLQYHWLPTSLSPLVIPAYIVLLIASGLLAGFIIYQGMDNARKRRASTVTSSNAVLQQTSTKTMTPAEREAAARRKRERHHKAVAARRRRAGKA